MSQKLILPINHTRLTASWKTDAYRASFGFTHYGADMVSSAGQTLVYSSGNGEVLAAGWDNILGNFLVVRYDKARRRTDGREAEIICRMYHFATLLAVKGQRITKDTRLGYYGSTGQYGTGAHLHLEMDRDTKYPFYTPTLSGKSGIFFGRSFGAGDSSMDNPLDWLYCKTSPPDNQSYKTAGDKYIRAEDSSIAELK